MELILLIVIAALAVISIVLSLAKGNNHAQAEQLQAALRQQMQEEPRRTKPQYPGTSHGNDPNAESEYATIARRTA